MGNSLQILSLAILLCAYAIPASSISASKLLLNGFFSSDNSGDKKISMIDGAPPDAKEPLTIMIWSGLKSFPSYDISSCYDGIDYSELCHFTDNLALYNRSEALVISMRDVSMRILTAEVPSYRFPYQKWILYETEPPTHVWNLKYWKQRERYLPYGNLFNVTCLPTESADLLSMALYFKCSLSDEHRFQRKFPNYAANKTKGVAWFVSHCDESSQRHLYVRELQKHIKVDVYGKCGPLTCGKFGSYDIYCDEELLHKKYKFYLSFENSICDEYVTEKLSRFIRKPINVIPIVLGGVDYKSLLPEGTYIDINDYDSPMALAEYLKYVSGADDVFNGFIHRKLSMSCERIPQYAKEPIPCRMCKYLLNHRSEQQQAPDVTDFYGIKRRCRSPQQYYHNVQSINY